MQTLGSIINSVENSRKIKMVNGILLTAREVDIVACLMHGRSVKKIAFLLFISPKTVEVHIRNLMLKIGCNSREKIIDFVESSENHLMIQEHYFIVFEKKYFDDALVKLNAFYKNEVVHLFYDAAFDKKQPRLISDLEDTLNKVGVKISKSLLEDQLSKGITHIIYLMTEDFEESSLAKNIAKNSIRHICVIYGHETQDAIFKRNCCQQIFIDSHSSFCLMVFDILCTIHHSKDFDKVKDHFLEKSTSLCGTKNALSDREELSEAFKSTTFPDKGCFHQTFFEKKYKWLVMAALLLLMFFIYAGLNAFSIKHPIKHAKTDLLLPSHQTLLERDNLLKNIDEIFNKNTGKIKHVMILGMGGIGKTTIARNYAITKNKPIFWEINAESETEIIKSFESLAVVLAKNDEERKEIEYMATLNNVENAKVKLMTLIQNHLYKNPGWVLIYDNVDNVNDIIQFLPRNQNIWGSGKILIVSRNQNILNSKYIDNRNVVQVPILNLDERKNLFQKIYNTAQNEDLLNFLKEIPPYPLDVSAAAYFLKNTKIGYRAYLKHIENYTSAFRKLDADILKNTDSNFKTRYTIVSNTIQKIIDKNDDFKNKFLEIGLLAPSSIPVELLDDEQHKVHSFILELSRYSLVNDEKIALDNSISLHRSVHAIIYLHLMEYLKSDSSLAHLKYFSKKIASQLSVVLDKEDINKIKSIDFQSGVFIKNVSHHVNDGMDELKYQMGRSYRYLGRFKEAILILESVKSFDQNIPVLLELGTSYTKMGKYHKAVLLIEKALRLSMQQYGSDSIQSARVEIRLDTPYRKLKKYDEERKVLEHSLCIHLNDSEADQADIAWIYTKLGHLQVKQGYLKEGMELFNKSLKIQIKLYGQNNIRTAWTYVRMANAYKESHQPKMAQALFKNSLKVYREHYGKNHPKTAWVLYSLGEIEGLLGHFKLAEKYMDEGLSIQKQYYGDNSIRLSWGLKKLAELYKRETLCSKANYYFNWIQKIQQDTKQGNLEE